MDSMKERFAAACHALGISQAEAARRADVVPQRLREIFLTKTGPSKSVPALAAVLGVEVEWLTTGSPAHAPSWLSGQGIPRRHVMREHVESYMAEGGSRAALEAAARLASPRPMALHQVPGHSPDTVAMLLSRVEALAAENAQLRSRLAALERPAPDHA